VAGGVSISESDISDFGQCADSACDGGAAVQLGEDTACGFGGVDCGGDYWGDCRAFETLEAKSVGCCEDLPEAGVEIGEDFFPASGVLVLIGDVADIDGADLGGMIAGEVGVDFGVVFAGIADEDEIASGVAGQQVGNVFCFQATGRAESFGHVSAEEAEVAEVPRAFGEVLRVEEFVEEGEEVPGAGGNVVEGGVEIALPALVKGRHVGDAGERAGEGVFEQFALVEDIGDFEGIVNVGNDGETAWGEEDGFAFGGMGGGMEGAEGEPAFGDVSEGWEKDGVADVAVGVGFLERELVAGDLNGDSLVALVVG